MPTLTTATDLQAFAAAQRETFNLPAITIALWQDGQLHQAASGLLNLETGVEATTDSVFQIGSITKVMTTCLVMQLVDQGRVELDQPVIRYLADFQVACPEATASITVRQLLNHTNGIAGDFFPKETGGGHLIARYIDRCNLLPQVHPIGEQYSYSNSAFVIAGRLVEVVLGISWYQAMQDYIFKPLGMNHALADPKELIRFRAAMGHIQKDNGEGWYQPEDAWLAEGMAPCGSTPTMSVGDLITFAQAHLNQGKNQQGEQWLSAKSVAAMQNPSIALPAISGGLNSSAGLGWGLKCYSNGIHSFGHNGATSGFYSSLQIFPASNAAYAVLINGVHPAALLSTQRALLKMMTGITVEEPAIDKRVALTPQHQQIAGHYESLDKVIKVSHNDQGLRAHLVYKIDPLPDEHFQLFPITDTCYGAEFDSGKRRGNLAFVYEQDPQTPAYCFDGSRLNPRLTYR